jgi:hypothetical protein
VACKHAYRKAHLGKLVQAEQDQQLRYPLETARFCSYLKSQGPKVSPFKKRHLDKVVHGGQDGQLRHPLELHVSTKGILPRKPKELK